MPHSDAFADLVIKLLAKDPRDRLGKGGASEILEHEYFSDCNFDDYMEKRVALEVPANFFQNIRSLTYFNQRSGKKELCETPMNTGRNEKKKFFNF